MKKRNIEQHKSIIIDFLKELNANTSEYVLKGGTSLMLCYGLDRFSEDIDLDGQTDYISSFIDTYCSNNTFKYRTAKDTETVKRFMIYYEDISHPLKVEVSFRNKSISSAATSTINGFKVYNLDILCQQKANAYSSRDKIRDLYDLCFICNNHFDELSVNTQITLAEAVSHKGIEQFDYLVKTEDDPLIDKEKLAESFLNMMDKLNLLTNETEREIINEYTENYRAASNIPLIKKDDKDIDSENILHCYDLSDIDM